MILAEKEIAGNKDAILSLMLTKRLSGVGRTIYLLCADYIGTSLLYPTTIVPC